MKNYSELIAALNFLEEASAKLHAIGDRRCFEVNRISADIRRKIPKARLSRGFVPLPTRVYGKANS